MTITTDNGANVLKMVRDVEEMFRSTAVNNEPTPPNEDHQANDYIDDLDSDIETLLGSQISDEEAVQRVVHDLSNENDVLLDTMRTALGNEDSVNILYDTTVPLIRCN